MPRVTHSRKPAVLWRCVRVHKGAGEKHGGKNTPLREYFVSAAPELPSKPGQEDEGQSRNESAYEGGPGHRVRDLLDHRRHSAGVGVSAAPELPSKLATLETGGGIGRITVIRPILIIPSLRPLTQVSAAPELPSKRDGPPDTVSGGPSRTDAPSCACALLPPSTP
jgi:hypothetical protein